MVTELDRRFGNILKDYLTPFLNGWDFRKRRLSYLRNKDSVTWYVGVQRGRWNNNARIEFTLNCGIFVPGVVSTYTNRPETTSIGLSDCCIIARIGMLSEKKLDKWWVLEDIVESSDSDITIGTEVNSYMEQYGLPFLSRFQTTEQILSFLHAPVSSDDSLIQPQNRTIRLAYAAILHSMRSEHDELSSAIEAAMEAGHGTPIEGVLSRLDRKLRN
ncbi:MAG: DUF4304 domain-containing protein [Planctomycetota bacterium]|nr:MAG: DUF4304 domain-containing protein [Planctomycetota bacterium]REK42187.1 MAG: DUF4304 domain-containing protein [Planctomycetota bacterium]